MAAVVGTRAPLAQLSPPTSHSKLPRAGVSFLLRGIPLPEGAEKITGRCSRAQFPCIVVSASPTSFTRHLNSPSTQSSSSSPFPPTTTHSPMRWRAAAIAGGSRGGGESAGGDAEKEKEEELLRALNLDPDIPESSTEFLEKVSSAAYDMRRRLEQTLQASEFDVVESNPWRREMDKAVYVLAKEDEQLYTMRTRRPRKEVEHELDLLFFRGRNQGTSNSSSGSSTRSGFGQPGNSLSSGNSGNSGGSRGASPGPHARWAAGSSGIARSQKFRVHVEDIREGILVFEDESEAANYCRVLDGAEPGQECLGVAQFPATELFKVCEKSMALAVVFKKGAMPPPPDYLRHTLKARKESLEDLDF